MADKVDIDALLASGYTMEEPVAAVATSTPERGIFDRYVTSPLTTALQGTTFGFGDELSAISQSGGVGKFLGDKLLGRETSAYDAILSAERGRLGDYREAHPYASFVLEVLGGAPLPGAAVKNASKAGLGQLMAQGAKTGGVYGGLYGFGTGEGGLQDRATGAGLGGGLGAVGGALVSPAINYGMQGGNWLLNKVGLGKALRPLSQAETRLKGVLDNEAVNATPEELVAAQMRMAVTPELTPAEASRIPQLMRVAKDVATTGEKQRAGFEEIIGGRLGRTEDDLGSLLNVLSPKQSVLEAGIGSKKAADVVMGRAEAAARRASKEAYAGVTNTRPIKSEGFNKLVNSSATVKKALRRVFQEPEGAALTGQAVDEVTERQVQNVAALLGEKAKYGGDPNFSRTMSRQALGQLRDVIKDDFPRLHRARQLYPDTQEVITKLDETILPILRDVSENNIERVGTRVMSLKPEKLMQFKDLLNNDKAFHSIVRSKYQNILDTGTPAQAVGAIVKDRKSLTAVLGKNAYERLESQAKGLIGRDISGQKLKTSIATAVDASILDSFGVWISDLSLAVRVGKNLARYMKKLGPEDQEELFDILYRQGAGGKAFSNIATRQLQEGPLNALTQSFAAGGSIAPGIAAGDILGSGAGEPSAPLPQVDIDELLTQGYTMGSEKKKTNVGEILNSAINANTLPNDINTNEVNLPVGGDLGGGREQVSGVTPEIMNALFKQESNHNPKAVGPSTKYGTAKGLGQLLDGTGKAMHKELGLEGKYDPFNAEQNAQISEHYLRKMYDRFGDIRLALAAYNWGPGNLSKAIRRFGKDYEILEAKLPGQTKHYVRNITKTVEV